MKKIALLLIGLVSIFVLSGCASSQQNDPSQEKNYAAQNQKKDTSYVDNQLNAQKKTEQDVDGNINQENNKSERNMDTANNDYLNKYDAAELETSLGKIKVKFYNSDAPITVNNFLKLADQKFYDGIKFHRVIKGFMIQGGDPNSKAGDPSIWGTGGPGYKFNDELKGTEKYPQGTLAMANAGPNTNGSQFFIVTASPEAPLPPSYTVFGTVVSGMDVALKIENVKTGAQDRPVEDVIIKSISLLNEK